MKKVEEVYKKLTQKEHVLHRPEMYIGSVKKVLQEEWIFDGTEVKKSIVNFTPGFIKIFDEILTNATDHSFRDETVKNIKVSFDSEKGSICVYNDGQGIPTGIHSEHGIHIPELLFGNLLSGSNYNDDETRTGAGTNGVGSTCTNIFSTKFIVETVNSDSRKKYIQEFSDNMNKTEKPKITSSSVKGYTKITFFPDYSRFDMSHLEQDSLLLLQKRVLDTIACTDKRVNVYLNGEKLKGKGIQDYVRYVSQDKLYVECFEKVVDGTTYVWEYAVIQSENFNQISFVNGNCTSEGGKHVDHIVNQIVSKLKKVIEEKKKIKDLKSSIIKDTFFIFLRSTVKNPKFSSQTKEKLISLSKDFGCNPQVSEAFITKLYKSSITDEILKESTVKQETLTKKSDGKKVNKIYIPKLEDAIWAGTSRSNECSLILTEGDSAATFAKWGRSVIGTERYGILPLRGKVLNVRDATVSQLVNNEEINNLKQIIGLKHNKVYKDTSELRYSKIILLVDSDLDGNHIKSLVVNFIHSQWESLIKLNFIQTLRTPIVKVSKSNKVLEFFTEQDYSKWQANNNVSSYNVKYYKGLGTSNKEDAKNTFKRINELKVDYYYKDAICDKSILLAFDKDKTKTNEISCADKRKQWLRNYDKNSYIESNVKKVSYQDLINKELIHFSIYDNMRSIPNLYDGFKPSQRKILYYLLKHNVCKSIKVAQLSGAVSKDLGYHHGEASLEGTIVGMAQDFVGSNNINLLFPDGSFGSRFSSSGKDAASARYIFTRLSDCTKSIFDSLDTPLLDLTFDDDGSAIEPEYFVPIIPMVLVNGASGIGTGFSTFIPPYNPSDIITNLKNIMKGSPLIELQPYFRGFNGDTVEIGPGNYATKGKWKRLSEYRIEITELHIGMGITNYKEYLESLVKEEKYNLKDVENHTKDENDSISFIVDFKKSIKGIDDDNIVKNLKLSKSFTTHNMYLFNEDLILTKYDSPNDILRVFYDKRLSLYGRRRAYLIDKLEVEIKFLSAKLRFISEYIKGIISLNNVPKKKVIELLLSRDYPLMDDEPQFDYILKMPLYSLTLERIQDYEKQKMERERMKLFYESNSSQDLWLIDLEKLNS